MLLLAVPPAGCPCVLLLKTCWDAAMLAAAGPWRHTSHVSLPCDSPAELVLMTITKKVRELSAIDLDRFVSYKSTDSTPITPSTVDLAGRLYSIHHRFEETQLGIGSTVVSVTDVDATLDFV